MKSKILRWLAIILIFETGLLHYMTAQPQFDKAPYLGYLAVANFVVSIASAVLIYFNKRIGWWLGLVLAVGSIIGFIVTRTIALPGLAVQQWNFPYGIVGTITEVLFILLVLIVQPWKPLPEVTDSETRSRWFLLLPLSGVILVAAVTFATYRWDVYAYQIGYHVHVGSLSSVCSTP